MSKSIYPIIDLSKYEMQDEYSRIVVLDSMAEHVESLYGDMPIISLVGSGAIGDTFNHSNESCDAVIVETVKKSMCRDVNLYKRKLIPTKKPSSNFKEVRNHLYPWWQKNGR